MSIKKVLFSFTLLTLSLTFGFALLLHYLELDQLSPFLMIIPLFTSFIVQKAMLKKPIFGPNGLGFQLGKKRFIILAPLFSLLFIILVYFISYLWNIDLFTVEYARIAIRELTTYNESNSLMINIVIAGSIQLLIAPFINIFIFIGEEVGWRGFLYPNLMSLYGKKGLIVGGFIWGVWHAPMIYLYDLNFGTHHHFGIIFMILFCILAGIILQFIYARSHSIYAVALMHGMLNIAGTFVVTFTVQSKYRYFIDGATGIIGLIILSIIASICYKKHPL